MVSGCSDRLPRLLRRRALAGRALREDRVHLVAFLARRRFRHRHLGQLLDQPLQDAPPDLRMRHLPAAEENRRLHLVPFSQEALDVLLLELIVVLVDLRAEFDFLHLDDLLVLLGRPRALLLLVLVPPEIHDAAHRRVGGRRNLDEVEPLLARDRERLRGRHDPELRAVLVDHADLTDPDAFVDPRAVVAPRTAIKSYKSLLFTWGSAPHLFTWGSARAWVMRIPSRASNSPPPARPPALPWTRSRPAPGARSLRRCARLDRPRRGCAPSSCPRPLRGRRSPACTGSSATGLRGSYNQSSPAGRPARHAARPRRAAAGRRAHSRRGGPRSAARSP